ncbi:hypothetical protein GCM10023079_30260 [Streptomyces chitinivorans]
MGAGRHRAARRASVLPGQRLRRLPGAAGAVAGAVTRCALAVAETALTALTVLSASGTAWLLFSG